MNAEPKEEYTEQRELYNTFTASLLEETVKQYKAIAWRYHGALTLDKLLDRLCNVYGVTTSARKRALKTDVTTLIREHGELFCYDRKQKNIVMLYQKKGGAQ